MTTIAVMHPFMGSDTMLTAYGTSQICVAVRGVKHFVSANRRFAYGNSGDCIDVDDRSQIEDLIFNYLKDEYAGVDTEISMTAVCKAASAAGGQILIATQDRVYRAFSRRAQRVACEIAVAIGSGGGYATAAAECGRELEAAIKYAATHDSTTGPEVYITDLRDALIPFIGD